MYNPDEECNKLIGRIEALCQERGITHNALAKEAGISTSTLSYLLSGKSTPYVYTIFQICNALKVPVEEILGGCPEGMTEVESSEKIVER